MKKLLSVKKLLSFMLLFAMVLAFSAPAPADPGDVCVIVGNAVGGGDTGYANIKDALLALADYTPSTIRLLTDIVYTESATSTSLFKKEVTIDLDGKDLILGGGLYAEDSTIAYANGSCFELRGGVEFNNSTGAVTKVEGSLMCINSDVTVYGDVNVPAGSLTSVSALTGSTLAITGNVVAPARNTPPMVPAVICLSSVITIGGDVVSPGSVAAGIEARGSGQVTVDGKLTANDARYVGLHSGSSTVYIGPGGYGAASSKAGYKEYSLNNNFIWLRNWYTVIFEDWDGAVLKTDEVPHGCTGVAAPAAPDNRPGWQFVEWSPALPDANNPITGDMTYTAQYEETYPLLYDADGGTGAPSGGRYAENALFTVSDAVPVKAGYYFDGWRYNGVKYNAGDTFAMPAEAVTLVAQWLELVTVTFDLGGKGTSPDQLAYTGVVIGSAMPSAPVVNANAGWVFEGWTPAYESVPVAGPMAFVAAWSAAEYEISYNLNGGINDAGNPGTYTVESPEITLLPPAMDGYVFGGWTPDGGVIPAGSTGDRAFEAAWSLRTDLSYRVDYYYDGIIDAGRTVTIDNQAFGAVINTYTNKAGSGYRLQKTENLPLTIVTDPARNVIRVFYVKQSGNTGQGGGGNNNNSNNNSTPPGNGNNNPPPAPSNNGGDYHGAIQPEAAKPKKTPDAQKPVTEDIDDSVSPLVFISDHIQYLNGYPDGSVRPENIITRAEAAALFHRLLANSNKNKRVETAFTDVDEGAWYCQPVAYLQKYGIVNGYPEGDFRPDATITRAEFATMASKFSKLAQSPGNVFSDVSDSYWAAEYINCIAAKGWIAGFGDGTFRPEEGITRAQAVAIINRMLKRHIALEDIPEGVAEYTDITASHWAYSDIIEASHTHLYTLNNDETEEWTEFKAQAVV